MDIREIITELSKIIEAKETGNPAAAIDFNLIKEARDALLRTTRGSLTDLYVYDRQNGKIHRVGDDQHDSLWVDLVGTVHYHHLQNGDGCGGSSRENSRGGFEFVPSDCGSIDEKFMEEVKKRKKEDLRCRQDVERKMKKLFNVDFGPDSEEDQ